MGYRELSRLNSHDRISGSGVLASNWLGPCKGSIVYSFERNIAYVGHFGLLPDSYHALVKYLAEIELEFDGFLGLTADIRGCHISDDMYERVKIQLEDQRERFVRIFKEKGFPEDRMNVEWGAGDFVANMLYNADKREIKVLRKKERN